MNIMSWYSARDTTNIGQRYKYKPKQNLYYSEILHTKSCITKTMKEICAVHKKYLRCSLPEVCKIRQQILKIKTQDSDKWSALWTIWILENELIATVIALCYVLVWLVGRLYFITWVPSFYSGHFTFGIGLIWISWLWPFATKICSIDF